MMDDSLADVQQERKMAAKELKLKCVETDKSLKFNRQKELIEIEIETDIVNYRYLDRNQAHLLKLYLEEHLK